MVALSRPGQRRAASADDQREARRNFQAGEAHFKAGHYAEALADVPGRLRRRPAPRILDQRRPVPAPAGRSGEGARDLPEVSVRRARLTAGSRGEEADRRARSDARRRSGCPESAAKPRRRLPDLSGAGARLEPAPRATAAHVDGRGAPAPAPRPARSGSGGGSGARSARAVAGGHRHRVRALVAGHRRRSTKARWGRCGDEAPDGALSAFFVADLRARPCVDLGLLPRRGPGRGARRRAVAVRASTDGAPAPEELRLWVYDDTGALWSDARFPERGGAPTPAGTRARHDPDPARHERRHPAHPRRRHRRRRRARWTACSRFRRRRAGRPT